MCWEVLDCILGKKKFLRKSGKLLEQAAQDSGGVPISGSVQEMERCGTEGCGLVATVRTY